MSDDYQRIEVITGAARRRRWTIEEKLRIVEETLRSGEGISIIARRNGVAPSLLYRWRRLMTEGGAVAVQADDAVTGNAELRRLEERMRELERQLGRKTLEVELLKEALARSRTKTYGPPRWQVGCVRLCSVVHERIRRSGALALAMMEIRACWPS
jgi:transposase